MNLKLLYSIQLVAVTGPTLGRYTLLHLVTTEPFVSGLQLTMSLNSFPIFIIILLFLLVFCFCFVFVCLCVRACARVYVRACVYLFCFLFVFRSCYLLLVFKEHGDLLEQNSHSAPSSTPHPHPRALSLPAIKNGYDPRPQSVGGAHTRMKAVDIQRLRVFGQLKIKVLSVTTLFEYIYMGGRGGRRSW